MFISIQVIGGILASTPFLHILYLIYSNFKYLSIPGEKVDVDEIRLLSFLAIGSSLGVITLFICGYILTGKVLASYVYS